MFLSNAINTAAGRQQDERYGNVKKRCWSQERSAGYRELVGSGLPASP